MDEPLEREIERNLVAFLPRLPELLPQHEGAFALLRHQRIQSIHAKLSDALKTADAEFADGIYSIQKITDKPVALGMFANVENSG